MGIWQVTLTPDEVELGLRVGNERRQDSLRKGDRSLLGGDVNPYTPNLIGALGELAVAKCLGIDWHAPVGNYGTGFDLGIYQVRCRAWHDLPLCFNERDKDDGIYILVTGNAAFVKRTNCELLPELLTYLVHGWYTYGAAKESGLLYTEDRNRDLYLLDQQHLWDIETLPRLSEYATLPVSVS